MNNKRVLMLAVDNQAEALRMAAGLTLLDAMVSVLAVGAPPQTPEVAEQMEALSFSDVPVVVHKSLFPDAIREIAQSLASADVVFVV